MNETSNQDADPRIRELERLNALMRDLLTLEDYDALLDAVVRHSLEILGAERGFLVLIRGKSLDLKVVRNWSREELAGGKEPVSRSIVREVLRQRTPVLVEDALSDPRFARHGSVFRLQLRSVLAAPIELEGHLVGVLYLESSSPQHLFRPSHLDRFHEILELSSRALQACVRRIVLEQRNALLEKDFLARHNFQGIVTRDPGLLSVLETAAQVASTDLPVLVQGPSGSGKELIVRALHLNSPRSKRPFLTINCGAISASLLESELFGHVRGAFTGALADRRGLLAAADTGTLFLDEIGELPRELQAKLLRTLQFGEIQPVGSTRVQTVNVRFLAATNRDLELEVREGRFREDLYYRLNVVTLHVPPLAERPDDVLLLFHHFAAQAPQPSGRPAPAVTPELEAVLQQYGWPGNVRELENETKRLIAITPPGEPLTPARLSRRILAALSSSPAPAGSLEAGEKETIALELRKAAGNRTRAAKALGISRETLRQKMKRYGLS